MSQSMQELLDEYSTSHQNKTNKLIHYFAVPIIFWSVTAIFWVIKIPYVENFAIVATALLALYYTSKDLMIAVQMIIISIVCLLLNSWVENQGYPLLYIAIGLFVFAWIIQFIGHNIEGKKPSFLKDIQFLLIGPAWIARELFRGKS